MSPFPDLASLTVDTPLPLLGPHLPTLLGSAAFFWGIQLATHALAPAGIAGQRIRNKWGKWDERTRRGCASHVVSQIHALIAIPLAIVSLQSTILAKDPVFGYDVFVGHALAFSAGYFIWDTVDSLLNSTIGFVIHGAACLAVYLFSFRPFLAGFGPCFLLWEASTPFLNLHWFMEKLDLATEYPTLFTVNSVAFIAAFFLARICYGGYNSYIFFGTMWRERQRITWYLQLIYCSGNLALNALNWMWFSKIFSKLLVKLQGGSKVSRSGKKENGLGLGEGDGDGEEAVRGAINEEEPLLRAEL